MISAGYVGVEEDRRPAPLWLWLGRFYARQSAQPGADAARRWPHATGRGPPILLRQRADASQNAQGDRADSAVAGGFRLGPVAA